MLKPFYNKKKNIDDRLVPAVTAADAGKALIVGEDGKITTGESGGGKLYQHNIHFGYFEGPVMVIITDSETPMDAAAIYDFLKDNGFDGNNNHKYPASSGKYVNSVGPALVMPKYIIYSGTNNVMVYESSVSISSGALSVSNPTENMRNYTITDVVNAI